MKNKLKIFGKYTLNKFINVFIAITLIGLIYSGINLAYALATVTNVTGNNLAQTHFTNLINETNNIINRLNIISNDNNTVNLKQGSNCTWKAITTHGNANCNAGQYITRVCLTNKDQGCPNGTPAGTGTNTEWYVAGGIRCCDTK